MFKNTRNISNEIVKYKEYKSNAQIKRLYEKYENIIFNLSLQDKHKQQRDCDK